MLAKVCEHKNEMKMNSEALKFWHGDTILLLFLRPIRRNHTHTRAMLLLARNASGINWMQTRQAAFQFHLLTKDPRRRWRRGGGVRRLHRHVAWSFMHDWMGQQLKSSSAYPFRFPFFSVSCVMHRWILGLDGKSSVKSHRNCSQPFKAA